MFLRRKTAGLLYLLGWLTFVALPISPVRGTPHTVSGTFSFDTRQVVKESDAHSSSFALDTRPLDGIIGWTESGTAGLDTGGYLMGVPWVQSINPPLAPGLDQRQWVTLTGRNFAPGAVVVLRTGSEVYHIPPSRTEVVSATQIRVLVNLTSEPAEWTAQVVNPGGTTSQQLAFSVDASAVRPPAGLDFGTVAPGGTVVKTFVLRNSGTTTASYTLTGVDMPFSIENSGSGQLAPGAEAQVTLRYSPQATGRHEEQAMFQIGGQSVTRTLSGRSTDSPAGTGVVFGTVRGLLPDGETTPLGGARVVLQRVSPLSEGGTHIQEHYVVTDSLGNYTLSEVSSGSYFIKATLDGRNKRRFFDHSSGGIPLTVMNGESVPQDVLLPERPSWFTALPKNMPVVLVRGLAPPHELPIFRVSESDYWEQTRNALYTAGFNHVWDPNVGGDKVVDGTKGVTQNALSLWEHLQTKIADYTELYGEPPRKVHFICHSMGGLILRQLLHNNAETNYSEQLHLEGDVFMLATPNAGSLVAEKWFQYFFRRFDELKPRYVQDEFATAVKWPQSGVRLFLATGNRAEEDWWLEHFSKYLEENGPPDDKENDGVVTVLSNRGEYFIKKEVQVVTSGVANSTPMFMPTITWQKGYSFRDADPYKEQQIVSLNHSDIINNEDVIQWIAGILANPSTPVPDLQVTEPQAPMLASVSNVVSTPTAPLLASGSETFSMEWYSEPEPEAQRTLVDRQKGTLTAGQSTSFGFPVDTTARLRVAVSSTATPGFTLLNPEGQTIGPDTSDPWVLYEGHIGEGGTLAAYTITTPAPGQWQVVVDATNATEDINYALEIEAESNMLLAVSHPEWRGHDVQTAFSAALGRLDAGLLAIPGPTVTAEIVLPDGTVQARQFSDLGTQGDGGANDSLFGLIHEGFSQPGEHEIVARINGTLPGSGEAFRRTWRGSFTVAAPGGFIAGEPAWRTIDADENGITDALLIELLASVSEVGNYTLTGRLRDTEQDVDIHAVVDFHREAPGAARAVLHFRPEDLPQGRIFGPFELYDVKLFKRTEDGLVFLDHRDTVSPVPVSLYNHFSRSIRVTGDADFGNVPVGGSTARELTVHNDGREALEVTALNLPSGFAANFGGVVIEPGESEAVSIVFSPSSGTAHAGTLEAESNALAGEGTLALVGQGFVPLSGWLQAAGVPPGQDDAGDDPNGDGLSNLLAYLYNVHPLRGAASYDTYARPRTGVEREGDSRFLTLTYRRNRQAVGVVAAVQVSYTLQPGSWQTVEPDRTLDLGTDPITGDPLVQVWVAIGATERKFIRLKVTKP